MDRLNLPDSINKVLEDFTKGLVSIYGGSLVSIILYGSAASGEFAGGFSNIDIAIVLEDAGLENIAKAASFIRKIKFRRIAPVFFTEKYIRNSADVFPIEFLDIKENRLVLYGRDVVRDLEIDAKNLRFQCEHELRSRLINMKRAYVEIGGRGDLRKALFKTFTSTMHLLRNVIRLKGGTPSYAKEDIVTQVAKLFELDSGNMKNILDAKNGRTSLGKEEAKQLYFAFSSDLEKIIESVDAF